MFEVTPPTRVTLIISVILAVVAVIVHFARIELPVFPTHGFAMLLVGGIWFCLRATWSVECRVRSANT